jgi:hypothetical protein
MQKSAEELGIDTKNFILPEEDVEKFKDYEFAVNGKVLESGKTSYNAHVIKKRNKN